MRWGHKRSYRRAAAAIALLGVAFYTLLLPWHLTSQFAAQLFAAEFGISADAMCRANPQDRSVPAAPATSCPICKGLASFDLAVAPPAQAELPGPPAPAAATARLTQALVGAEVANPRNRGPPLPA